MRIVYKLPLLLALFTASIAAVMLIHEARIVFPAFEKIERDLSRRDLGRVLAAIDRDAKHLAVFTRDWSQWDDTYLFAIGRYPEYIDANLDILTWENTSLDAVAIYGPGRELSYSGLRDRAAREVVKAEFFPKRAPPDASYIHAADDFENKSGLLPLGGRTYLIASCPILPSDGSGPARGSLIMCRAVDDAYASALSEQTGVPASFSPAAAPVEAGGSGPKIGERSFRESDDRLSIEGHAVIAGIDGRPALAAMTRTSRDISVKGMAILHLFRDTILSSCLLLSLFLLLSHSKIVSGPIVAMRARISRMDEESLSSIPRSLVKRRDEIGDLARAFGELGASLIEKRRELEDANANLEEKVEERTFELALLAKVVESTSEAVVLTDLDGNIVKVNEAFCRSSGYSEEEVIGRNPSIMKSGRHDAAFYEAMWKSIAERGWWAGEVWDRHKSGEIYPKWLTINKIVDERGLHCNYVGVSADITEVKASEERLQHLAYYDPLTGLPNRALFRDRLERAVSRCTRFGNRLAVIFVDLDRFKYVNDTLGHAAGDKLLVEVARRLSRRVRESDTVCRLGGDEFTLVLERLRSSDDAARLAESILDDLSAPMVIDGKTIFIGASMGISIFPYDDTTSDGLTRKADAAMYRAKELGRNNYRFVSGETEDANRERLEIDLELRGAVENSTLALYYQPIVDPGGRVVAAEALLRWKRDAHGEPTLPARSISLAEESGLILRIGDFAMREACKAAALWNARGREIRISVNVSARQFEHAGLARLVSGALEESRLSPRLLDIEITESTLMADIDTAQRTMGELKSMGVGLSLDDFGTGYASLSYISRFPLDRLKIDRSFVREAGESRSASSLVCAILAMASSLGMKSIAEGVETETQRSFLVQNGCDELQGFFFSHPLPRERFEAIATAERIG